VSSLFTAHQQIIGYSVPEGEDKIMSMLTIIEENVRSRL